MEERNDGKRRSGDSPTEREEDKNDDGDTNRDIRAK